ncbi:MAG: hypothetical protein ABR528_06430 [Pseudonocardiaceae bacterium]
MARGTAAATKGAADDAGEAIGGATRLLALSRVRTAARRRRVTRLLLLARLLLARCKRAALTGLGHSRAGSQDLQARYPRCGSEHEKGQSRCPRQLARGAVRHSYSL